MVSILQFHYIYYHINLPKDFTWLLMWLFVYFKAPVLYLFKLYCFDIDLNKSEKRSYTALLALAHLS